MAGRTTKKGLDFAAWDVHIFDDDERYDELLAAQDWNGFAIYFYLCTKAYATNGYYYQWKENSAAITARRMGGSISFGSVKEVISLCLHIGLFDKRLYERWSILTNKEMQERYMIAVEKRSEKGRTVNPDYWLLSSEETKAYINFTENGNILPENGNILPENGTKESKVKESKVNKRKTRNVSSSDKSANDTADVFISLVLNDKSLFQLTNDDVKHYCELYPAVDVKQELRNMCGWLESNPQKRKTRNGIKGFITRWLSKTQDKGGVGYGAVKYQSNVENTPSGPFRSQTI